MSTFDMNNLPPGTHVILKDELCNECIIASLPIRDTQGVRYYLKADTRRQPFVGIAQASSLSINIVKEHHNVND